MAKVTINVTMEVGRDLDEDIDESYLEQVASDLGDSIVELVNAKKGIYGTVSLYINGEQYSSMNFD